LLILKPRSVDPPKKTLPLQQQFVEQRDREREYGHGCVYDYGDEYEDQMVEGKEEEVVDAHASLHALLDDHGKDDLEKQDVAAEISDLGMSIATDNTGGRDKVLVHKNEEGIDQSKEESKDK
jgi:hypothetical protein